MLRLWSYSDLHSILALEKTTQIAPWSWNTLKTCFEGHYLGWVIEKEKEMIGFIVISLYVDECHVLNICVGGHYWRQGWGSKLLTHVFQYAKQQGAYTTYLEVSRSNQNAISFYQKLGFYQVSERRGYYLTVNGREDALILAKLN